ncbi:hypothetical protein GCM10009679_48280 [Saccharothrix algeriensis]|uniref:GerMN domain-containing protein n=3 Tax=Catellatospora bangladeshensis TaxID=310355 RepID=A0A8J3JX50_9ACTN|nr:hypothetical protein Cba03nite_60630 [Catellatospora bangladeshensis]
MSLLLAGVTVVALAGCGIGVPEGVVHDGPGPSAGPGLASPENETPPKWSPNNLDPRQLVMDFLQAPAGDHVNGHTAIMNEVRKFLADGEGWEPGGNLTLVRVVDEPSPRGNTADVTLRHLGTLTVDGEVIPSQNPTEKRYRFKFVQKPGGPGLVLAERPDEQLMLDVDSLTKYYAKLPIYFWNSDDTALVPDVRYMPTAVAEEQRNNRLFDWLNNGSSAWLEGAVKPVPKDTQRVGSIVEDAHQLTVNLGALVDQTPRDTLAAQLYWTLWPEGEQRLQLQMDGRDVATDYRFPEKNLAVAARGTDPGRYAVVDGVLRRLRWGNDHRGVLQLDDAVNRNVVSAAVARDEAAFALVRNVGGGQRLFIGSARDQIAEVPGLRAASISRPIWLDRAASTVLVLADGRPWVVSARDRKAEEVRGAAVGKTFTGLTVAPDGRRMALVREGNLYVAALKRQGTKLSSFAMGDLRRVPTSLDGQLQEVAFMQEDTLVVSSSGDKVSLAQVTIDGAIEQVFPTNQRGVVTNLTAYVANAGRSVTTGSVLLDLDGEAHLAFEGSLQRVGGQTMPVVPPKSPEPSPSTSPSASASPAPPIEPVLSAACFEG